MSDMCYFELVDFYRWFEKIMFKILKIKFVVDFLKKILDEFFEIVLYLIFGKVFFDWDERELGVGEKFLIKVVFMVMGVFEKEIEDFVRDIGDLGESVVLVIKKKKQKSFFLQLFMIKCVYDIFVKIVEV